MSDGLHKIDIRRPQVHELAEAGSVTVAAYRAGGMALGGYVDQLQDTHRRHREAELLVAVDPDGRVLGTVTFCPAGSSWREIARSDEAEFRMLAVDPAAQRQGVGRALVEACLGRARSQGFRGIVLSTPLRNAGAHRLYEQLGFVRDPDRDWTPVPGVDLVAYARPLD